MHVFMIGDSVFDNAAYVRSREPDVARQAATLLTNSNGVSSTARDGAVVADVRRQIANLPKHATHIVVSAGGNDALQASHVLDEPVSSMLDALAKLTNIAEAFRSGYAGLLDDVACAHLPVAVCTIYDPRFPDPRLRKGGATALSVINDAITREASPGDLLFWISVSFAMTKRISPILSNRPQLEEQRSPAPLSDLRSPVRFRQRCTARSRYYCRPPPEQCGRLDLFATSRAVAGLAGGVGRNPVEQPVGIVCAIDTNKCCSAWVNLF